MDETLFKIPDGYEPPAEALQALDLLESGCPLVYLAGRAGCGKSTFIEYLKSQRFNREMLKGLVLVAPTGIAAINIGAQTIHSFFKIAPHDRPGLWDRSCGSDLLYTQMTLLVIEEISMVRADLLDIIDEKLRFVRGVHDKPFGGVPILCVGDIFQLPPIITKEEAPEFLKDYKSGWFFDAKIFNKVSMVCRELKKVFRQSDPEFLNILQDIRLSKDPQRSIDKLNRATSKPLKYKLSLTSTNAAADNINQSRLERITCEPRSYFALVGPGLTSSDLKSFQSPQVLTLKVGTRVMATANIPEKGIVNGHLGWVRALDRTWVEVEFDFGSTVRLDFHTWTKISWEPQIQGGYKEMERGTYSQIPLRLGWSVSIHRSQGLTLDSVEIDLGRGAFASGQTYVALSRCKTLKGIHLVRPLRKQDLIIDRDVLRFSRKFLESVHSEIRTPQRVENLNGIKERVATKTPPKSAIPDLPPLDSYEIPWDVPVARNQTQTPSKSLAPPPLPKSPFGKPPTATLPPVPPPVEKHTSLDNLDMQIDLDMLDTKLYRAFIISNRRLRDEFKNYLESNQHVKP